MESPIWRCCSVAVWGRARKRDNADAWLLEFCPGGCCPTALTLMPDTSFLLVCYWFPSSCFPGTRAQREWIWVSPKSIVGPFRGNTWESLSFFCCPSSHWFLESEVMGTYLPGTGTPDWVVWCGTGIPCSRGVPPDFYPPHVDVGPPVPCLHVSVPLTCLDECDFFNSLVVGLPYVAFLKILGDSCFVV